MDTKQFLYGLLITVLFSACKPDPQLEIKPSKPAAGANSQISGVDVYVDCSGSMKGYVAYAKRDAENAKQSFKTVVPSLITNIEQKVGAKNLKIYNVKDGYYSVENSVSVFYTNLTTGRIFGGATTELNEIIARIIGSSKNKLSILITDGVLSFGPAKLKQEGEMYNILNKDILKSYLHHALAGDTTVSVALVKYLSDFNGTYYYTCMEKTEYTGKLLKNRPFYVIAIGKKELLSSFICTNNLLPQSEGVFTVSNPIELEVALFKKKLESEKGKLNSLLKVTNKKGVISATTSYEEEKDKVFIIGIKKSNIPPAYYKDESKFFSKLKCDNKNITIEKLTSANGNDGIDENALNPNEVLDYDFFYKITLHKKMFANHLKYKQIVFFFEPSLDVKTSHIDKDYDLVGKIDSLSNKTWGLKLITEAIKAANHNKQPQGARFTLTLNMIVK